MPSLAAVVGLVVLLEGGGGSGPLSQGEREQQIAKKWMGAENGTAYLGVRGCKLRRGFESRPLAERASASQGLDRAPRWYLRIPARDDLFQKCHKRVL